MNEARQAQPYRRRTVADRIRDALLVAGCNGLTRTQIAGVLSRHVSSDAIANALEELRRNDEAWFVVGEPSSGRPAETWYSGHIGQTLVLHVASE